VGSRLGLLDARLITMLEDHRHRRPGQLGRNGRRQLSLEWCHRCTRRNDDEGAPRATAAVVCWAQTMPSSASAPLVYDSSTQAASAWVAGSAAARVWAAPLAKVALASRAVDAAVVVELSQDEHGVKSLSMSRAGLEYTNLVEPEARS
jgi:hypothetical protein